jgi:N-acetylmuramoyl-L-alanine amidase
LNRSLSLAKNVLIELGTINNLHRGRVESAAFVVLKSLEIPSMLVETAYISNPKEEMQLSQTAYQAKLASAIFKGVNSYYKRYIPKARYQVKSKSRIKSKLKSKVSPKSYKRYTVRKGDTLMSIVRKHKVTLSQLKNANSLQDTTIRSGQRLKIPNF